MIATRSVGTGDRGQDQSRHDCGEGSPPTFPVTRRSSSADSAFGASSRLDRSQT